MSESFSGGTVDNGDVGLSYVEYGHQNPPVLILHGLAGSGREFELTAQALLPRRVILPDLRGHGHSTRRPADVSREALVSDVVAVIETLSPDMPVILVGQSVGGHIGMLAAARYPHLVEKLVLLEVSAGGAGDDAASRAMRDYFESWPLPFPDLGAATVFLGDGPLATAWVAGLEFRDGGWWPRFDADVMEAMLRDVDGRALWDDWESVDVPTLLLFAEHGMFSAGLAEELTSRAGNARRVDIPGASHDAHLNAFPAWIKTLRDVVGSG